MQKSNFAFLQNSAIPQGSKTKMYSLLLALIYIAFISLGLPDSLLGSAWPTMHYDLEVPVSYMGIISMVISGGTIASSLLSDKLTRKLGTRIVTVVSVILTSAALFGFSFATEFWMLIVFAVPYGLGAGAVDAALNNYVALHYKARHMSWLHCFWGVGTIVSPFIMSFALTNSTWNDGYRIVGYIQLGISVLLLATLPVWKVNKKNGSCAAEALRPFGRAENKGRTLSAGWFFCLLRAGIYGNELGKHIFCRSKRDFGRAGGAVCLLFLYRYNGGKIFKRVHFGQSWRQADDYCRNDCSRLRNNSAVHTRPLRPLVHRFYCNRPRLRPHISLHNPLHSRQLRRRKLGLGNRNTDGRRIYRFNIRSAAVRTARKTARLQHSAGIPDYFCGFDDNDDRTYVPHGGEGKRTGKHPRPNLKKYALTSDVKITEAGICMPASAFTLQ